MQRHFHLRRVGHNMIVREDVALLIDNKSRTLSLLWHHPVEEVEGHGARSHIHHRRDVLAVDENIVLFFTVESFIAGSFGDLHLVGMTQPIRGMNHAQGRVRTPRREVEECAGDHQRE